MDSHRAIANVDGLVARENLIQLGLAHHRLDTRPRWVIFGSIYLQFVRDTRAVRISHVLQVGCLVVCANQPQFIGGRLTKQKIY